MKTKDQEEGEEGGTTTLWSSSAEMEEGFLNLLSPDQMALLEKMVQALINQGHTQFGNKAVSKLMKQRLKNAYSDPLNTKNSGGGSTQKHPLLADVSGLRAKISPAWQTQDPAKNNPNANQKDQLLHKLKLANAPKLKQAVPPPKQTIEYKPKAAPPRLTPY